MILLLLCTINIFMYVIRMCTLQNTTKTYNLMTHGRYTKKLNILFGVLDQLLSIVIFKNIRSSKKSISKIRKNIIN